jgi:hypothetical protein
VEAKARYRAVKIQPQWVVTPGKQTSHLITVKKIKNHFILDTFLLQILPHYLTNM